MSKIYMLIADNGQAYEEHRWWNVAAFTSREAATTYIDTLTAEIEFAERFTYDLEELWDERGYETLEERAEYEKLNDLACQYWHFFDHGEFRIEEFEVRE